MLQPLQLALNLCVHQLALQINIVYILLLLLLHHASIVPQDKEDLELLQMLMQCLLQIVAALLSNALLVLQISGANGILQKQMDGNAQIVLLDIKEPLQQVPITPGKLMTVKQPNAHLVTKISGANGILLKPVQLNAQHVLMDLQKKPKQQLIIPWQLTIVRLFILIYSK